MRVNNMKSAFAIAILMVSLTCFIYVNTASRVETPHTLMTIKVNNAPVKQTTMPDLTLVKTVVDLIGKFITAK